MSNKCKHLLLVLVLLVMPLLLAGCMSKVVKTDDYIEYSVEGVDGQGVLTTNFNHRALMNDANISRENARILSEFTVTADKTENLSNGDEITLTVEIPDGAESALKLKFTAVTLTVKVEGLEEAPAATQPPAAEESQTTEAQTTESQAAEAQPAESQSEDTQVESKSEESQPQETPAEGQPAESQAGESQAESQPAETQATEAQLTESQETESQPAETQAAESQTESKPTESQPADSQASEDQPAEPSVNAGYVTMKSQIPAETLEILKADTEARMRERESWDMDAGETLKNVTYMETVLVVSDDGQSPHNALYVIFRLTAGNGNGEFSWYDCFRYTDLTLDSDGKIGIDFTTVQGLYGHHIAEDNRTYYYYYTGYSTLDEVRDFAENELGSGYSARQ